MSQADKENSPPAAVTVTPLAGAKRPCQDDVFTSGPRKRAGKSDPLLHSGRHFGRTVQTFCRVQNLIAQGLARTVQLALNQVTLDELSPDETREHRIYTQLLALNPTLEERISTGSRQDIFHVADLITKGSSSARSDDTRSLKVAVVEWITPVNGLLDPPLTRNVKTDRGFHHSRTGELLCPVNMEWSDPKVKSGLLSGELVISGDMWPRFLYQNFEYNPEEPWEGLFRSGLLVRGFKHVFTSPSSVDSIEPKATRACNARIHGMTSVTIPSLAYIATQVRFALSSSPTFCRTDRATDSEAFYNHIITILEDPEEQDEVSQLLAWWDRQIFPQEITSTSFVHKDSVIAKIKERRRRIQAELEAGPSTSGIQPPQSQPEGGSQT